MIGRGRRNRGGTSQDGTASGHGQVNQVAGDQHIHHHYPPGGPVSEAAPPAGGTRSAPGRPLEEVTDPFALEVHRPITARQAAGSPDLPVYVRRAHDERLAELVARAAGGASVMAVLVAGSSAGKTRACWEALEPLRRAGGWRLWHPFDPTRPQAALRELERVAPRTVVWLNETQDYLGGGQAGEQVAAKLRSLLADPARAPVLVLGTLWPEHHAALTRRPESQVRQVLDGTIIEVPATFTGPDLAALEQAARTDARLAAAVEHADEGQITQYLAGGPALLERFHAAPAAARALIEAAMDARRMGHRGALPHSLLEQAATAYLTDAEWDRLGPDWLDEALAYTSQPCKGARGPVTRIRPHPARGPRSRTGSAGRADGEPVYRLADYLDQYGRAHRAERIPPIGFWTAAAAHAHPDDLLVLGNAARARGLYRDAAQLLKNATSHGAPWAADALVGHLYDLDPADHRPARWATEHTSLGNTSAVVSLLDRLREAGADEQVGRLAERAAAGVPFDDPIAVSGLLTRLRRIGTGEPLNTLLSRDPGEHAAVDDPRDVVWLLNALRLVQADEQVRVLAERAAAEAPVDDPEAVEELLAALWSVAPREERMRVLAERAAAEVSNDDTRAVGTLLSGMIGAGDQAAALVDRDPAAHAALDDPYDVAWLLRGLKQVGANDQVTVLLGRDIAERVALDDPSAVNVLLGTLRGLGADEQADRLAERVAAELSLDAPTLVSALDRLPEIGETRLAALAGQAAARVPIDDPQLVGDLLDSLRRVRLGDQMAALLGRDPAAHVALGDPGGVAWLLRGLEQVGADDQVTVLLGRDIAEQVALDDPGAVGSLLQVLREFGAEDQVMALLARDPAAHAALDDSAGVDWLLDRLREAGADEQANRLAERAAAELSLADPGLDLSLNRLRRIDARQVAAIAERLPAAGRFDLFMEVSDHKTRFRFGREPDMTPAAAWGWDDLE